ncbi:CSLREA domain-containing protein, partial [Acidobacteria bacterium AH-259-G07]|nr:CSLREA domain-containing protein [Acidobacteria bacterium AH-259-G07]
RLLFFWAAPLVMAQAAFTVNSTADPGDGVCDATECTLREAIAAANANPGTDMIEFNIPGTGPHTIQPGSALPEITGPVVIDGYTQPMATANTNGPGMGVNTVLKIELDGILAGGPTVNGLTITAGNSTVRGLVINRFSNPGIVLKTNGGNVIEGNFIGSDVTGTVAQGNGRELAGVRAGVVVVNASNNTIGGTATAARNLISGNFGAGVHIGGGTATGNVVQGNLVGTDVTGTVSLMGTSSGVVISNAPNTIIGGTTAAARNVISGNLAGVILQSGATGTWVQGNFIGTDLTGKVALGNRSFGVFVTESSNNTIGGTTTGARNIISANGRGLVITDRSTGNVAQGNYIGTDVTGTMALGNAGTGVAIGNGANNNTIGGTAAGAGNVISANGQEGINIAAVGTTDNAVQGNYIGTDATGTLALGNRTAGVNISNDAFNNLIGGTTDEAGNIVAFNFQGVLVSGVSTTGNAILSNSIFSNGALGINLTPPGFPIVTPNDNGDADIGGNNLQNFPELTSATTGGVEGTLNSTPNTTFRLEFFATSACDPSGFGEGETFLGSTTATTDGSGNTNFTAIFFVPLGQLVTATATDPDNNTSEFSFCDVEVVALEVGVDIKPPSCPNPLDVKSGGLLPVVILGTIAFDVTQVDPASVRLAGVAPLRSSLEDVATPFEPFIGKGDLFDCTDLGPDGLQDLTLKFDKQQVLAAIGEVNDGDVVVLQLTGSLNDGSGIVGEDVVVILK